MTGVKVEHFEAYGELEPYQAKLAKFIAVLATTSEIVSGEPIMPWPQTSAAVDAVLATPAKIKEVADFQRLTGWTHARLLNRWKTDKTTTCNEFVQQATLAMGFSNIMMGRATSGIGRFDIADTLTRIGLGHCWVDANSGDQPRFGDIFRLLGDEIDRATGMRKNHMGISLGIKGSQWTVAEGGQGGSRAGQDKVKINGYTWKPDDLTGWVDMRSMLNVGRQIPSWLGGWWEVTEDVYPGFYYFAGSGAVYWSMMRPSNPTAVPGMATTFGTVDIPNADVGKFKIHWQSADSDEDWTIFEQPGKKRSWQMVGTTAGGKKLSGKRIVFADAFDRVPKAA